MIEYHKVQYSIKQKTNVITDNIKISAFNNKTEYKLVKSVCSIVNDLSISSDTQIVKQVSRMNVDGKYPMESLTNNRDLEYTTIECTFKYG